MGETVVFSTIGVGITGYPLAKECKRMYFTPYKNELKMNQRPKY